MDDISTEVMRDRKKAREDSEPVEDSASPANLSSAAIDTRNAKGKFCFPGFTSVIQSKSRANCRAKAISKCHIHVTFANFATPKWHNIP